MGTLRGVHKTGTSPHDVLATLNRRLMIRGMPRRYTAIRYAVFNPHSHELQISSAGMPGPFHFSANGGRNLKLCGIPPGLFAAANYETLTLRLARVFTAVENFSRGREQQDDMAAALFHFCS